MGAQDAVRDGGYEAHEIGTVEGPDDWTAKPPQQPFGRSLTVAVGVAIVSIGLFQFYDAKFMEKLKPGEMAPREGRWTRRPAHLVHAARGVVFLIVGVFLAEAAIRSDPDEARGLGGALSTLAGRPFGPYLLGLVARYRRIETAWSLQLSAFSRRPLRGRPGPG